MYWPGRGILRSHEAIEPLADTHTQYLICREPYGNSAWYGRLDHGNLTVTVGELDPTSLLLQGAPGEEIRPSSFLPPFPVLADLRTKSSPRSFPPPTLDQLPLPLLRLSVNIDFSDSLGVGAPYRCLLLPKALRFEPANL